MYNLVGRRLFNVGRHLQKKLCKDTSMSIGTVTCALTAAVHCTSINHVLSRNYCNNNDESNAAIPKLLAPDEEAEIKMKKFLEVPENEKMKKIIELEIEVMRQNNEKVPDTLKPRHWYELVNLSCRAKRRNYLLFVWKLEKKRENLRKKKAESLKVLEEKMAEPSEDRTTYRLGGNSMFLRFYDSSINHVLHGRLMNRMLFGQQIVLDCGYEKHMSRRELRDCAKQLQITFAANRIHDDPFDLYLCNVDLHGDQTKHLNRYIPPLFNDDFPLNVTSESYLNLFNKEKLIYLTPHCQQEMTEFDHDAVYIIGALVDKSFNDPLSMAKAKREGIRMLKFPLDRYLHWGWGSAKNLTLNQVLCILLDLRKTGSWDEALKHVPRRKLFEARVAEESRKLRTVLNSESSSNYDNYTTPVQEFKPKERFIYKPDRTHKKLAQQDYRSNETGHTEAPFGRDFTMKARTKLKTNFKN